MFEDSTFGRATALVIGFMFGCGGEQPPADERHEIIANLVQAGFPADDILVADDKVYVGRDAHVTLEASREMLETGESSAEQYRTTNLVDPFVGTICVQPTWTFASYSRLMEGLDAAIANLNALGLRIRFSRSAWACGAIITANTMAGDGGVSGFPSWGRPYGSITIGTGLQAQTVDVNEHVITHELGHAIGLRHSDYYNRSISCGGTAVNEGAAGVGAIHITGTPTTATVGGSIMNSCYRTTETGELTSSDITTFQKLYCGLSCPLP